MTENQEDLIKRLTEKYDAINQKVDIHLEGLVHAKPITYWDYIQPEALLNLQVQRSTLPDEMVFIMYHQINELLFKMILWEIDQVCESETISAVFFTEKLKRISRYFDMLSSSFTIMGEGMEVAQYQQFRNTLTPASGFQSAQYRIIEFASCDLINLIDDRFRKDIDRDTPYTHAFEHLYWQAAGKDHATGKKNTMLVLFEERYKEMFLRKMEHYNTRNLWQKFTGLPTETQKDAALIMAMRHYDYTVNVTWVMCHYHAAGKYLGKAEATGGSDWRKYMHPKYQRRIFFPALWSADELANWAA
jgi:tryptophan 2,3-dioxygenase